jgi:hypothetical protein
MWIYIQDSKEISAVKKQAREKLLDLRKDFLLWGCLSAWSHYYRTGSPVSRCSFTSGGTPSFAFQVGIFSISFCVLLCERADADWDYRCEMDVSIGCWQT